MNVSELNPPSSPSSTALPEFQTLRLELRDDIAWLFLNHGKANEMGRAEVQDFERLAEWLETAPVRTLVTSSRRVTRSGTPVFIAGANVTERAGWTTEEIKAHVRFQRETLARLRRVPVYHIAVVAGMALGWGTEFLLCCDYRVLCPGAKLGLPETGLGILPGAGGSSELSALVGVHQALRLGMTGELVDAAEAVRIGLGDELAADLEAGLARAEAVGKLLQSRSPTAIAAFKQAVLSSVGQEQVARQEIEARAYEHCVNSGEAAIGRAAFSTPGAKAAWGPYRAWMP